MLKTGSKLKIVDNSGALSLKVLNFKKKKNLTVSSVSVSEIIYGVIQEIDTKKKKLLFRNKEKVSALIVTVKKKKAKKNGIFIRISQNTCIPLKITRFINPYTNISFPVFYEIKLKKKFRLIKKKTKHVF